MQQTSATWKQLWAAGAALEARATVGGVAYTDISAPVIRRAAMQNTLSIGNVAAASLSLVIRGAGVVPRSAAVVVEARLNDGQTASEWLPQGTFYISRRARDPVTGLLALECYDALLKANALWVPTAGTWPRTMASVAAELAALLGLSFDSRTTIPSGPAFVIAEPPAGTTVRDALGMIAQAGGGNWIVTPGNRLRLLPVGVGTDTVSVTGVTGGMKTGPTGTVTGVRCSVDGLQTMIGDDTGIVVDATIPPVTAADMAGALIGQTYQPFSLAGAIYDPAAELGDAIQAGAGGEVASALYSETATLGAAFRGDIEAPEAGELADEYPYIGSGQKTLALAKAAVAEAVGALDDSLTQQDIFNRLTANGAAQGLVLYNGQLYVNASYIQSGTLVLGGANNRNGTLQVKNGSNNVFCELTNTGFDFHALASDYGFFVDLNGNIAVGEKPDNMAVLAENDTFQALINGLVKLTSLYIYGGGEYGQVAHLMPVAGGGISIAGETDNDTVALLTPSLAQIFASLTRCEGDLSVDGDANIGGALNATDKATTRANLGITPANIGAVDKDGDTMDGDLTINGDLTADNITLTNPLEVQYGGTGANTAAGARTNLNVAEKQLCESPNSQWHLEMHDDGVVRVWQYDSSQEAWGVAGVLRDGNGVVPVAFGGTGANTAAGALANLGVINRIFSVTFDSNGFGTVNYPPQGYTLMAGNLGPDRIITVQGVYVVARSISGWTDVITNRTLNVTLLYVKNN